jgi:hypothetical protein
VVVVVGTVVVGPFGDVVEVVEPKVVVVIVARAAATSSRSSTSPPATSASARENNVARNHQTDLGVASIVIDVASSQARRVSLGARLED